VSGKRIILEHKNSLVADWWELYKMERTTLQDYSFHFHLAVVSLAIFLGDFNSKNMSVSQKMFACSSFALIAVLMFTQANPVPVPEEVHPGNF